MFFQVHNVQDIEIVSVAEVIRFLYKEVLILDLSLYYRKINRFLLENMVYIHRNVAFLI